MFSNVYKKNKFMHHTRYKGTSIKIYYIKLENMKFLSTGQYLKKKKTHVNRYDYLLNKKIYYQST